MRSRKPRLSSPGLLGSRLRDSKVLSTRGRRGGSDAELGPFRSDCDAAIGALRRALLALAEAVGCDPLRPQEVSRRLGLNKNLTWKVARILAAPDSFEAISMLPGGEGVEIYLRAFASAGVDGRLVARAREAFRTFDEVVERHFGDRGQLELVLDGLRSDGNLENSRRLAFRGMSGVFGVQAKMRLTAQIIAPSPAAEDRADLALVVGLVGLQRLRPLGSLPVFRTSAQAGDERRRTRPLFPGERADDFMVREFSSFPRATVHASSEAGRHVFELSEGPLGRFGASDLFFGSVAPAAVITRGQSDDRHAEFLTAISIPAEGFASDLFVHRSIGGIDTIEASVHSTLAQPLSADPTLRAVSRLPIDAGPILVEDLADGFGLSGAPRYGEIIARAFEALRQDPRDYRLVRVALPFPPVPAALLVRWELPE